MRKLEIENPFSGVSPKCNTNVRTQCNFVMYEKAPRHSIRHCGRPGGNARLLANGINSPCRLVGPPVCRWPCRVRTRFRARRRPTVVSTRRPCRRRTSSVRPSEMFCRNSPTPTCSTTSTANFAGARERPTEKLIARASITRRVCARNVVAMETARTYFCCRFPPLSSIQQTHTHTHTAC